jgi:hypothetical protein
MKRIILLSMVIGIFLSAGPLAALDYKGPRVEVKELRYDFGKVVQGTQAAHVFEIRNVGGEQLVIEKIQPS